MNDYLGHDFGDKVLCRFVTQAQKILREEDIFCRFGGEEFVALLPNTSSDTALVAMFALVVESAAEPHIAI